MWKMAAGALVLGIGHAGAATAQQAQDGFLVCPSQQEIEQYVQTEGELVPDSCRFVTVVVVESEGRRLCAADISQDGDSVLGAIADAAVPTQWWADCDEAVGQLE